jgi:hypothetical protein
MRDTTGLTTERKGGVICGGQHPSNIGKASAKRLGGGFLNIWGLGLPAHRLPDFLRFNDPRYQSRFCGGALHVDDQHFELGRGLISMYRRRPKVEGEHIGGAACTFWAPRAGTAICVKVTDK